MVKLGPLEIIRAASRPPMGEQGGAGAGSNPSSGGHGTAILAEEDYLPDLQGGKLYDEVDRMRLSDSQIRAALSAITLPLRAADWHIERASDSPQNRDIAEWLERQLIDVAPNPDPEGLRPRTWNYILRHNLLHLPFGCMPFETVWEIQDDPTFRRPLAALTDLAPRMPRTITEWQLDDRDRLAGIKQGFIRGGNWQEAHIPAEKLLVFVNEQEGSNYRGVSILRAARKNWLLKERAEKLNQIALEKRSAGVDVGTLTNGSTKKAEGEAVLMGMRVHERAYVQETDDWKYRIEGITGTVLDPLPTIQYHDLMILRGLLAEFLAMGGNSTGSLAMHQDKTGFFLMSLGAIARQVEDPYNMDLLPRWVTWNWPGVREYPRLTHSRLDRRDAKTVADSLASLVPQGIITPDPDLEREVREMLELPEPPEEAQARRRLTLARSRPPRNAAERLPDFAAMARGLDDAQERIVRSYLPVQRRQIANLVEEAGKAVERGDPDRLQNIAVRYKTEAAEQFAAPLIELYRQGQREVRKELAKAGAQHLRLASPLDPTDDDGVRRWLRARSTSVASALAERLRGAMLRVSLDMIRRGDTDRGIITARLTALSDREIQREAGGAVSEALNLGRDSVAAQNETLIRDVYYSALIDSGACPQCAALDGQHFIYGSEAMRLAEPPYRDCSGYGNPRCRCVLVYILTDEV